MVRLRWQLTWLAWLVPMISLGACPAGGQLLESTDPQREVDLGRQVARQVEQMIPLSGDPAAQERVKRVGRAIVEQLEPRLYPYEFKVLARPDYNAFALPGGFVYVFEGLLDRIRTDDELAFVLAHEVAHAAKRHWARRTEDMKGVNLLGGLAAAASGGDSSLLVTLAAELIYLRYSRSDENEADQAACEYLWKAGFDPAGAVAAMETIVSLEKGEHTPRYLRNHPPARERLERVRQKCEELKAQPPPSGMRGDLSEATPSGLAQEPPARPGANPWFPLAVGNWWEYQVTGPGSREKACYRLEVVGKIPESGAHRARVSFGKSSASWQVLTSPDEVWVSGADPRASAGWRLECSTGWEEGKAMGRGDWRWELVGTEPVTTPCGRFAEAMHVRRLGPGEGLVPAVDVWLVRGVGMVRREVAETGVVELLTGYHVEPAAAGEAMARKGAPDGGG